MDPLSRPSLNPTQVKAIFYQAATNPTVGQCQGTCWAALSPTRIELLLPRRVPSCTSVSQLAQENGTEDTELFQSPLVTDPSEASAIGASMHKAGIPLEYFTATSLDISVRSGPFRRQKDLQLGYPWPRQRTRWVAGEGGWNDTSPSASFLASFSLPSCQQKKKKEMKWNYLSALSWTHK